ncbi:aspartyl-phosphate phosphatase Spo0E family protein [Brevibacillus composti]|uniref:Aspartyl-phosphate phosphatase Spo0E family protein n=1 Tax=Brevibacillus composti TaxID=2796470 RepID=A0A7T5JQI0_9BACL|nr:aspartyl-phosphate phosphatase Spo0E family protein [Brevibacillus composti]QQE76262.1 aspartyl-phosphate phosphatase Spo0E family protein [Brevibacillus composti]QUO43290.1 aspartyl-phosphate phosphatase Spo0E family protein [Brevibacillus composti]
MEITQKMIDDVRQQLEVAVRESGYNFLDPEIVKISQQLDKLIVAHMTQDSKRP